MLLFSVKHSSNYNLFITMELIGLADELKSVRKHKLLDCVVN